MFIRQFYSKLALILVPALAVKYNTSGIDNKGTEFIFGFLPNSIEADNPVLEVFVTTNIDENIRVTVELPVYNHTFKQIATVRKSMVMKVVISSDILFHNSGQIDNKGIRVSATKTIMAYASNSVQKSADALVLLPVNVLDNEYFVMSWSGSSSGGTSAFLIIGIEHDTVINITLSKNSSFIRNGNTTYGPSSSFTIEIDKFQTFYLNSKGDLTGTHIVSSKHVSVISGNTCNSLIFGFCDHMAQQMLPASQWGYDFVAIGMPNCQALDTFRILSSERNTYINISGITIKNLKQPGDFYTFSLNDTEPIMVMSDKPINLVLYPNGGCKIGDIGDPSAIPIPAVSQYLSTGYMFKTLDISGVEMTHSLSIVMDENLKDSLMLDGKVMTGLTWMSVIGSDDMVYTDFIIANGTHSINHVDSSVTFMAFSTGIQFHVSYGFPLGYNFEKPYKVSYIIREQFETSLLLLRHTNKEDTNKVNKT